MDGIEKMPYLFQFFDCCFDHLHSNELEASLFEALDDFVNEAALNSIGLDGDECALTRGRHLH